MLPGPHPFLYFWATERKCELPEKVTDETRTGTNRYLLQGTVFS